MLMGMDEPRESVRRNFRIRRQPSEPSRSLIPQLRSLCISSPQLPSMQFAPHLSKPSSIPQLPSSLHHRIPAALASPHPIPDPAVHLPSAVPRRPFRSPQCHAAPSVQSRRHTSGHLPASTSSAQEPRIPTSSSHLTTDHATEVH